MKFWRSPAALLTVFHPETTHTGYHSTHKDVKNEGRSDYMDENKWRATKCHARNAAFYTKMHPLRGDRQQASGPYGRLCTNYAQFAAGCAGAEDRMERPRTGIVAQLQDLRSLPDEQ